MKDKTTRFSGELAGKYGDFWKNNALREIEDMQKRSDNGEICLDENKGAFWKKSGNYLPEDCAEKLSHTDFDFSMTATEEGRRKQTEKFLEEYLKNPRKPSEEELFEMRAAFGTGTTVIDVFSGQKIAL